jgi:hypothetical protein
MSDEEREREEPMVIRSADELLRPTTRRSFVRMLGLGSAIVLMPSVFTACSNDDDNPTGNQSPPPPPPPPPTTGVTSLAFDLRTDVGILQLTQTLEIIEGFFYTQVVSKSDFASTFTAEEQEILLDIRNTEVLHREVIRAGLGAQAVPDFTAQINTTTLATLLASKTSILAAARMFETTGVATLNGAGKFVKDPRNLLFAGKLASVEGRHLAALRDISVNNTTAFAGDDSIDSNGRDVKIEASVTLAKVKALNLIKDPLNSAITISNPPDASQGAANATPDLFPANP